MRQSSDDIRGNGDCKYYNQPQVCLFSQPTSEGLPGWRQCQHQLPTACNDFRILRSRLENDIDAFRRAVKT